MIDTRGAKTQCPICQAWVKNKFMPNHVAVKHGIRPMTADEQEISDELGEIFG